ncbi:PPA1309 family protein [Nocardioides ultimimeridianus]
MDYELDVDPALASVVLELEKHHAGMGWDQPAKLYALVDTAQFVAAEPALAMSLGLDDSRERGSLTSIEQDELPSGDRLEDVLGSIGWPPSVAGCAVVVERLVLPPAADGQVPEDPAAAEEYAREHPDREEVRIVAGVTRDGSTYCAVRLRSEDDDAAVMGGADVVPNLVAALRDTLLDEDASDE